MKYLFLLGLFLVTFLPARAQLTVTVPTITATPGQIIYLPVKLYGASSSGNPIMGCEVYISFNNTVLTNGSIVNYYSGMSTGQWYGTVNQNGNGLVSTNWMENNLSAIPIPDGTTLFEIKFTYIGGTSPLTFETVNPMTIFISQTFNLIPSICTNGSVGPPMPTLYAWTGATSNDWTVSTNWNPARTSPASTDILQFNTGGTVSATSLPTETIGKLSLSNNTQVTIAANAQAVLTIAGGDDTDLEVPSGCLLDFGGPNPANPVSLVLNSGTNTILRGYLTVSGNLTNNAGGAGFLVQSDAAGFGSLITLGTTTGTVNVERYLGANSWHYLSSPVANATSGIFVNDYLRTSDPATANGWGEYITSLTTILEPARGYAAWLPTTAETKIFSGTLNTGNVSILFSRNPSDPHSGWNMAGNPYPSSIDLNSAGISWGNIEHTAWFWNGTQYETFPVLSGYGTHSQYVPAQQGFFTHINSSYSGSTSLAFSNASRTHSAAAYLKATPVNVLAFSVQGSKNAYLDKAVVHFMEGTTADYDPGFDAKKFFGIVEAPQIYSILAGEIAAVNVLPWVNKITLVPLGFKSGISDTYTISFSEIQSFSGNIKISLEDVKMNRTQDLVANPVYEFSYSENEEPARFILHFENPSIGVEEPKTSNIKVYSSDNSIYINNNGAEQLQGDFFLFDVSGRKVYQGKLNNQNLQKFNIDLPKGYYLVHLVTNRQVINQRIYLD